MTWGLARFVASFRHSATASPDHIRSNRSAAIFGLAPITDPRLRPVSLRQVEFRRAMQEGVLMARRLALIETVRKLRRDHRATCSAMADLRAVTLAILAQGEPC